MWASRLLKRDKAFLSVILNVRNCKGTLNTCQLHARTGSTLLVKDFQCPGRTGHRSVVNVNKPVICEGRTGGLLKYSNVQCATSIHARHKHGKGRKSQNQDEESDSDEEDSDQDDSGAFATHYEDDEALPNNCSEIKKYVKSLRVDSIVSAGLNISRNKVDDYFLGSKLLLNGEKVLKKSKQMSQGDSVDLISEVTVEQEGKMKVKRVRVVKVDEDQTSKGKLTVYLRCWKGNVLVDKVDKWSPRSKLRDDS